MNNIYPSIAQFEQQVQLKDFRPRSRYAYVRALRKLAEHFECDPAPLTEDQVRQYFLFLREQKHYQGSAMTLARAALRCFFLEVSKTGQDWTVFEDLRIARPEPLPLVLSREEVGRVLGVVHQPRFRVCLRLIYHCGLRVGEAVSLAPTDIHGRETPPRLHIKNGKGGKDRYVPIAVGMVEELRQWWKTHGNRRWLFPTLGAPGTHVPLGQAQSCMAVGSVQEVFVLARQQSGIHPKATVHTLRHCYATHLLEAGVNLRQLRDYLGHRSLDTTLIYTHLTQLSEARTQATLQALYQAFKG
jgi:integrase/recombinase XerD